MGAKVAELVLWIGYLQWQVSVGRLDQMPEPILQDLQHIRTGDALISWEREEVVVGSDGQVATRAAGVTDKKATRTHVAMTRLVGVGVAEWPEVDYVIGNPPFIGNKKMMDILGHGYVSAIRAAFAEIPGSADLVMFWWWRAGELLARKAIRRFGFVTTNKITQTLNRAVVVDAVEVKRLGIVHAIADHPWYDEGAAVRIAMTVVDRDWPECSLGVVADETRTGAAELDLVRVIEKPVVEIQPDLSAGAKVRTVSPLKANSRICFQGFTLVGEGFRLSQEELRQLRVALPCPVVKPYVIGDYVVQRHREEWVIDFFGYSEGEAHARFPALFDHVVREVKPQRDAQNDKQRKENWWLFGRSGKDLRNAVAGLRRYIATSRTARHRVFVFLPGTTLPDTKVVAIALDDAAFLAVLSSRVHVVWSVRAGGRLGVGNDPTYNHTEAFVPFPFPSWTAEQHEQLEQLGERLETHRRSCQNGAPGLALSDMYGVMEKLRAGGPLTHEEAQTRAYGLVDTLMTLHDEIDAVTFAAYGWSSALSDEELLEKVVALNSARREEEERGQVRWLRAAYQSGAFQPSLVAEAKQSGTQDAVAVPAPKVAKLPWPGELPARIQLLTALLRKLEGPTNTKSLAQAFKGAKMDDVEMTLRCAAAADAVVLVAEPGESPRWAARE